MLNYFKYGEAISIFHDFHDRAPSCLFILSIRELYIKGFDSPFNVKKWAPMFPGGGVVIMYHRVRVC